MAPARRSNGGAILVLVLAGAVLGMAGFTFLYAEGLSYFSTDPKACANCHIMNDQYVSWTKGPHHGDARCVDCHLPHETVAKYFAKAALALQRKAQWRIDFVAAENSMGFHAPAEAARILTPSRSTSRARPSGPRAPRPRRADQPFPRLRLGNAQRLADHRAAVQAEQQPSGCKLKPAIDTAPSGRRSCHGRGRRAPPAPPPAAGWWEWGSPRSR